MRVAPLVFASAALLSALAGCGASGPELQGAIRDYQAKRLSSAGDDPLFLLEIDAFSGTLATADLQVETTRGALTCAHPSGDAYLRAGSLVLCSEPGKDLFDAPDEGTAYAVRVTRRNAPTTEWFVATWTPVRPLPDGGP